MVLPKNATAKLALEWDAYVRAWPNIPDRLKAMGISGFWRSPEVLALFPKGCEQLQTVAFYWASFPVANVNLERAFGKMRAMEGPQRYSLSSESVNEEMMVKCNPELVDALVTAALSMSTTHVTHCTTTLEVTSSSFLLWL